MSTQAALEFDDVVKQCRPSATADAVTALDGFSLRVERGEIFGFLGPNGAGKTTAMNIAMGLTLPSSGHGRLLEHPFGHALTRQRVGFLAENVALYHRPADKLVRFYGALNGMHDPQLRRRTDQLLKERDLTHAARRNAGKLSRATLQRVGLPQDSANDAELLTLDEPASSLDPIGRIQVPEILLRV